MFAEVMWWVIFGIAVIGVLLLAYAVYDIHRMANADADVMLEAIKEHLRKELERTAKKDDGM